MIKIKYTPSNQTIGYSQEIESHKNEIMKRDKNITIDQALKIIELGIKAQKLDMKEKYYELFQDLTEELSMFRRDISKYLEQLDA